MADIINEVSTTEPALPTKYEQRNALTTLVMPKSKARRAPSRCPRVREPKVIEPEAVVAPPLDEVHAEVTFPFQEAKAEAKVECPR